MLLVSFDENYVTVFAANFYYRFNVVTYWTARSGVCYKNWCTRPKSNMPTSYENALWTNGI